MTDRRSVLWAAAWGLPGGFLLFTGGMKLLSPEGTPPASLTALLDLASWPTWLRLMGALEVGIAVLLALRRTRAAGAYAAFVLLATLSALVALNAHDGAFVANCGCMGAARLPAVGWGEVEMLLLRNGVLLFLLALVPYLRPGGLAVVPACARAGTAAALVLLALLTLTERSKVEDAREDRQAREQGAVKARSLGWFLPPLAVVPADGPATTLAAWAQPLDTLLFVSTRCEHCVRLGDSLSALQARLASQQGRLVVVVVSDDAEASRTWLAKHGLSAVTHARLPSNRDAHRLGVDQVPAWISLDRDRRVAAHDAHGGHVSLPTALAASGDAAHGLLGTLGDALGARVAGPGVRVADLAREPDGSWWGTLVGPAGNLGRLVVRADGSPRGYTLELAIGLDADQRILGVVPLARGSLVPLLAPDIAGELAVLKGMTVLQALEHAAKHLRDHELSFQVWRSVHRVFERVRLVVAPPSTGR